jgi:hypothetical protein
MDDEVVNDQTNLRAVVRFTRAILGDKQFDQSNKAIAVFVVAGVIGQLTCCEVDSSKTIAFDVLSGCRDLSLAAAPCLLLIRTVDAQYRSYNPKVQFLQCLTDRFVADQFKALFNQVFGKVQTSPNREGFANVPGILLYSFF